MAERMCAHNTVPAAQRASSSVHPTNPQLDWRLAASHDQDAAASWSYRNPAGPIPVRSAGLMLRPSQVPVAPDDALRADVRGKLSGNPFSARVGTSHADGQPAQPPAQQEGIGIGMTHGLMSRVQPKLMMGQIGDPLEDEADRVADQVMRIPEPRAAVVSPQASRMCSGCKEEEGAQQLQANRAASGAVAGDAPAVVTALLRSPGRPLEPGTRRFMEARLGHDLGNVRIHTGPLASRSAEAVMARAYTVGRNVVFREGEYAPGTTEGRRLLAHELAHVLQQHPTKWTLKMMRPSQVAAVRSRVRVQDEAPHVDGPAARANAAMHAAACKTSERVAFKASPSLWLTAHEAAHVVQQRGGVRLPGGVGQNGDPYEHQANMVADRVVSGQSANNLLTGTRAGGRLTVQRCAWLGRKDCNCAEGGEETTDEMPTVVQRNSEGGTLDEAESVWSSAATTVASVAGEVAFDAESAVASAARAVVGTGLETVQRAAVGRGTDTTEPGREFAGPGGGSSFGLQRKVDEESFAQRGGQITEIGSTGEDPGGVEDSNEFVLWNYQVGSPEPQVEHLRYLADKVFTRWPGLLRADPGLKIAVVGGASSTGGAAITTPLSVARAEKIKADLVSAGIATGRIVTSGVGARHPFADETSAENMARNRRVEVFLFRPTRQVASLPGVSVEVRNLHADVANGWERDVSDPEFFNLRWLPFVFTAQVNITGPPQVAVGIVQFLRADSRTGYYQPARAGGPGFVLDFGRCMQPDLPCKDLFESMGRFSGEGQVAGPGSGTVSMRDRPGLPMPMTVNDPEFGRLAALHWEMEFVSVIGAWLGDAFLPVKSVVWHLEDDHALDSSGALNPTRIDSGVAPPQDGAPSDLQIEKAMAGRTCRFMARRMKDFCRPERA